MREKRLGTVWRQSTRFPTLLKKKKTTAHRENRNACVLANLGDLLINETHLRQTASPSAGEETVLCADFTYWERTTGAASAVQGRTPCNGVYTQQES